MKALFELLGSKTDETIKNLDELVSIPTQVPPGENYEKIIRRSENNGKYTFRSRS